MRLYKRDKRSGREAAGAADRVRSGLRAIDEILLQVARGIGQLLGVAFGALAGPTAGLRRRASALVSSTSALITPARGLLAAALGCALLLGLSQFADYRGVAIGAENYNPSIQAVAPAPEVERDELGTAHSYLMLPAALIAGLILVIAAARGRWQLCRIVALIGIAALLVSFLIDRPAGLDEGIVARDFAGAEAKLLGGFWVQVFAAAGLTATSLMLGAELRRSGDGSRISRRRRRAAGPRPAAPAAEGADA